MTSQKSVWWYSRALDFNWKCFDVKSSKIYTKASLRNVNSAVSLCSFWMCVRHDVKKFLTRPLSIANIERILSRKTKAIFFKENVLKPDHHLVASYVLTRRDISAFISGCFFLLSFSNTAFGIS